MIERKTEVKKSDIYPFSAQEFVKGWIGSGFKHKYTELQARRVKREGEAEEVQIEIGISTVVGEKSRLYRTYGALVLTPEQAKQLIDALSKVVVYEK